MFFIVCLSLNKTNKRTNENKTQMQNRYGILQSQPASFDEIVDSFNEQSIAERLAHAAHAAGSLVLFVSFVSFCLFDLFCSVFGCAFGFVRVLVRVFTRE